MKDPRNKKKAYGRNAILNIHAEFLLNKDQINSIRSAVKHFAHRGPRMSIANIIQQFIFVTVGWIIQTTVLLGVKFFRRMFFIGAVRNFELFVLIGDVCHDE